MKINWSGRSHDYSSKDISYLTKIIKKADPLTQGKYLKDFQIAFGNYIGRKNVFAVSSAAAALEIIAILLNLKKGDEVIIPAHTYCATAIPFARNGAKIIWSDINFNTRVVDINDIKNKITKKTKAIIIVHLYGYTVNFNPIVSYCNKKKIKIIEDCAQAFGARINSRKAGSLGDFACFSFHAQKNITTLGEGGAIFCKDNILAKKIRGLRHNGHSNYNNKRKSYWKPAMGNLSLDIKGKWPYKFTLSEIQAAAGYMLLKRVDKLNLKRIERAKKFINALKNFNEVSFFSEFKNYRHVYHLLSAYIVPSKKLHRDKLISLLFNKFGIKCVVQYYPLYRYDLFKSMGLSKSNCPITDKFYDNMISFPFHIQMSEKKFNYMISSTIKALKILTK